MKDKQHELHAETPLQLLEAEGESGPFNEDGTANIVIIRPGQARGVGRRFYPAQVLESHADMFTGWPVFDNHESPAVKKARGPFPRSTSELRGEIRESHWDPEFSHPDDAKFGHSKGAVIGKLMPTPDMRALIESCPSVIKLSINAFATGLRQQRGATGSMMEAIEGFDRDAGGSVDAVTKAGAGGRVLALFESDYDREHGTAEGTLSEVGDDDLLHHLREHRPHLAEAFAPEQEPVVTDVKPVTVAQLLESEELSTYIATKVDEGVAVKLQEHNTLQESATSTRVERKLELRDLRDAAHRLIREDSKLPPTFQADLIERYSLTESGEGEAIPSASLNIVAERDGEGAVVKPAIKVLQESLEADFARERLKLAEARPTRVSGQGTSSTGEGGTPVPTSRSGGFAAGLRRSGVDIDSLNPKDGK